MIVRFIRFLQDYFYQERASVAVEASFIFPIMLLLFFGVLDMGQAIMTNQKTIKASQVAADLITRNPEVSDYDVEEAMDAASLSLEPYTKANVEFDIISIRFNKDDGTPEIVWRETTAGMTPVQNVIQRVEPISEPGSGVVMVVVRNTYEPIVAGFVIDAIPMEEVAFAKSRRSDVVCREGISGCS